MTNFLAGVSDDAWVKETLVPVVRETHHLREKLILEAKRLLDGQTATDIP